MSKYNSSRQLTMNNIITDKELLELSSGNISMTGILKGDRHNDTKTLLKKYEILKHY